MFIVFTATIIVHTIIFKPFVKSSITAIVAWQDSHAFNTTRKVSRAQLADVFFVDLHITQVVVTLTSWWQATCFYHSVSSSRAILTVTLWRRTPTTCGETIFTYRVCIILIKTNTRCRQTSKPFYIVEIWCRIAHSLH